jgi:hypothetical protein
MRPGTTAPTSRDRRIFRDLRHPSDNGKKGLPKQGIAPLWESRPQMVSAQSHLH